MNISAQEKGLSTPTIKALSATQIVAKLSQLDGWRLHGDGIELSIEKTFNFVGYLQAVSFVNAVAYMADRNGHHPDILLLHDSCSVRFRTREVQGVSKRDFESAMGVDSLCNATEA